MAKPTVLIVEDDMAIALEAEILLLEAGFVPVGHAADSAGARALARRLRPDVALVDVRLRDGSTGSSLARSVADELGTVVVLSSTAPEVEADHAGAVGVIEKPFAPARFRAAMSYVQDILDGEPGDAPPGMFERAG
jgi:DNA-binding response OmpR family regulator